MVTFTLSQRIWELNHVPYMPSCQRCANYSIWCPNVPKGCQSSNLARQKAYQFFNCFSKEFFNYLNFSIILNIWEFQEYFGNSRKLISWNKEFKFWHFQNFIKEKSPKIFDVVFNGACGINWTIIRLVRNRAEYIFLSTYFYMPCVNMPI